MGESPSLSRPSYFNVFLATPRYRGDFACVCVQGSGRIQQAVFAMRIVSDAVCLIFTISSSPPDLFTCPEAKDGLCHRLRLGSSLLLRLLFVGQAVSET
jgi:hypothetical protein